MSILRQLEEMITVEEKVDFIGHILSNLSETVHANKAGQSGDNPQVEILLDRVHALEATVKALQEEIASNIIPGQVESYYERIRCATRQGPGVGPAPRRDRNAKHRTS